MHFNVKIQINKFQNIDKIRDTNSDTNSDLFIRIVLN